MGSNGLLEENANLPALEFSSKTLVELVLERCWIFAHFYEYFILFFVTIIILITYSEHYIHMSVKASLIAL